MSRLLFLVIIFSLILIDPTNADFLSSKSIKNNQFSAKTFDFSNLNTTNQSNIETLFNIENISPSGYSVNTLRIKNQGNTDVKYAISFKKESGNDNFCQALHISISQVNTDIKTESSLVDLDIKDEIKQNQNFTDWLIFLTLDNNFISNQPNECNFIFEINGQNSEFNQYGFKYRQIVKNHVAFANKK